MKHPELYYLWTRPWAECEMCCLGPTWLYAGEDFRFGLGLFFFEFGIRFKGKLEDGPTNRYVCCHDDCMSFRKLIPPGDVVEKCPNCGDEEYKVCPYCGIRLEYHPEPCPATLGKEANTNE